jgi:hypothetical protein
MCYDWPKQFHPCILTRRSRHRGRCVRALVRGLFSILVTVVFPCCVYIQTFSRCLFGVPVLIAAVFIIISTLSCQLIPWPLHTRQTTVSRGHTCHGRRGPIWL